MVNQSREKFFQKLSKRELQFLCRNLGIPFGQRKDLLANTLAALPEHYFESKYRSSQSTTDLSSLPHNSHALGYNDRPVQSYGDVARYSIGHNLPNNQFIVSNTSPLGVETMNIESASTREEKYLNPEYDSARGSFSQAVSQCHQANIDSNGLQLPGNTQSNLNLNGHVQAHKIPNNQFNNIHIAPLAAGISKKREEYFLKLPKKQLIHLCRKIQLPLTSTKCGLARNLATMPECYFDPEYWVNFDANGVREQRPSSKNDSSFTRPPEECNVFNRQYKDINVCPLPEGTVTVGPVSKSKEVNTYQLADTSRFQPVPQYSEGGFTNQEIANTSSRPVPPCDKYWFPDSTASNKSRSSHVQQFDGSAPSFDALSKAYGKSKYIEDGSILNAPFKEMTATQLFADSMTTTKANCHSFEFHVRSKRGINLYVDLNSNLSSWAESLNRDVNIMESSRCKKPQTFQDEIVHFAESKLQNTSTLTAIPQDLKIITDNLNSSPVLRSENKNSSYEGMDTDVPICHNFNAENEIGVARTVGSAVEKAKVDSFGSLSGSMSEGASSLAMIEQASKNSIRSCYRCSFWPYGCDKCSVRGSLEMKISEATVVQKTCKTAVLTSDDNGYHSEGRDGDVPKAIEESRAVFLLKPVSNIQNQISVSSIVPNASDCAKMDSLSRLESDGATSLVTSEGPSKLAAQGCHRCFCWQYGCETCSKSGAINMKIREATDFQQNASSRGDLSHDLVNQYRNRQCEQGLSINSSEVNHGSDRSQLLKSAEHPVGGNNASGVLSPE